MQMTIHVLNLLFDITQATELDVSDSEKMADKNRKDHISVIQNSF